MTDVCETADRLVADQHPENSVISDKKAELLEAWARLKFLTTARQQKLLGAHEIQRFNRCDIVDIEAVAGIVNIYWTGVGFM